MLFAVGLADRKNIAAAARQMVVAKTESPRASGFLDP